MKRAERFYETISDFYRRVQQEHLGLYAAQASFFLIISFVPLLMLLVTLLQFVLPVQKEDLLALFLQYLPANTEAFLTNIVNELFSKQAVSIISVSSLVLLWSASRGVHSVIKGLKHIFHVPSVLYFKERLRSLIYTVALILTFLFALIVLVFGNSLWALLLRAFPLLAGASALVTVVKFLSSALLITLFSMLLFTAACTRELASFKIQFPGALFTAAGWVLFSTGFSLYITNFSDYSYIYGSLTAIILLMLWLYFCLWLLFLGAQINYSLYQKRNGAQQIALDE